MTFSDEVGIFVESIDSTSILIGNQPSMVEIVSTTSSSVTAKFLVNSTLLTVGTNVIKSGQVTVQNRWLYPMEANLVIGNFVLSEPPPQAPITVVPISKPISVVPVSQPIAIPTAKKVSGSVVLVGFQGWAILIFFTHLLFI